MHTAPLILLTLVAVASSAALAQDSAAKTYSLDDLQGGWWAACDAPAVEFFISGNEYSGDFAGVYSLSLTGDVLVFNEGFADGHSVEVTHEPARFRILDLNEDALILRSLSAEHTNEDWRLWACDTQPEALGVSAETLEIGATLTLQSRVLSEARTVHVALPRDYEASKPSTHRAAQG